MPKYSKEFQKLVSQCAKDDVGRSESSIGDVREILSKLAKQQAAYCFCHPTGKGAPLSVLHRHALKLLRGLKVKAKSKKK